MKKSVTELISLLEIRDRTLLSGVIVPLSNEAFRIHKDDHFVHLTEYKWFKDVLNKEHIASCVVMRIPYDGVIKDNEEEIARVCDEIVARLSKKK